MQRERLSLPVRWRIIEHGTRPDVYALSAFAAGPRPGNPDDHPQAQPPTRFPRDLVDPALPHTGGMIRPIFMPTQKRVRPAWKTGSVLRSQRVSGLAPIVSGLCRYATSR